MLGCAVRACPKGQSAADRGGGPRALCVLGRGRVTYSAHVKHRISERRFHYVLVFDIYVTKLSQKQRDRERARERGFFAARAGGPQWTHSIHAYECVNQLADTPVWTRTMRLLNIEATSVPCGPTAKRRETGGGGAACGGRGRAAGSSMLCAHRGQRRRVPR